MRRRDPGFLNTGKVWQLKTRPGRLLVCFAVTGVPPRPLPVSKAPPGAPAMSDGRAGGTAVPFLNGFVSKIAKQFEILMWARYPEQFSQTARSTLVKLLRWLARLPMVLGVSNAAG